MADFVGKFLYMHFGWVPFIFEIWKELSRAFEMYKHNLTLTEAKLYCVFDPEPNVMNIVSFSVKLQAFGCAKVVNKQDQEGITLYQKQCYLLKYML